MLVVGQGVVEDLAAADGEGNQREYFLTGWGELVGGMMFPG